MVAKLSLGRHDASMDKCSFPNVVSLHGSALDGASFHPPAAKLRRRGAAVFVPDIRCHGVSAADPSAAGDLVYMRQNPRRFL